VAGEAAAARLGARESGAVDDQDALHPAARESDGGGDAGRPGAGDEDVPIHA
jgi:hypothetical protein